MSTVLSPAEGAITWNGSDVSEPATRRDLRQSLGYLPQELGYYPGFTALEFVTYVGWLRGMRTADARDAGDVALRAVGLDERLGALIASALRCAAGDGNGGVKYFLLARRAPRTTGVLVCLGAAVPLARTAAIAMAVDQPLLPVTVFFPTVAAAFISEAVASGSDEVESSSPRPVGALTLG